MINAINRGYNLIGLHIQNPARFITYIVVCQLIGVGLMLKTAKG